MKTGRVLAIAVALGLLADLTGVGGMVAPADVAGAAPSAEPPLPDAACASDDRAFRALVETVRAKSDELARREAELKSREAGLSATRKIVSGEVARLEAVAKALGITGAPGSGVSIARVYEQMDAEDAAPILDRLDDATLRAVLGRMRERQVAAILAAMSRDRAVAVTKAFAVPAATPPPAK